MIFAITNRSEFLSAYLALIRLLSGVSSHVDEEVTLFSEDLATIRNRAFEKILSRVSGFDM